MPQLRLMKTGHGDQCLAEWNETIDSTHLEARIAFDREMAIGGRMAFRIPSPGVQEPIRSFDPTLAGDVLIVPAIQGG